MNDLTTKLAEALRLISFASMDRGARDTAIEALRLYDEATAQPVQDLPPLPEPVASQQLRRHNISGHERWFGFDAINPPHDKAHYAMVAARPRDLYTAEQMRDYARAALSATPAPAPVAWLYTLEYGTSIADRKVSLEQLRYPFGVCGADYLRVNDDGTSYVRETPLYQTPKE